MTAAVMHAAAILNERAGFVRPNDATDLGGDQGVTVTQADVPGSRIYTPNPLLDVQVLLVFLEHIYFIGLEIFFF